MGYLIFSDRAGDTSKQTVPTLSVVAAAKSVGKIFLTASTKRDPPQQQGEILTRSSDVLPRFVSESIETSSTGAATRPRMLKKIQHLR